MSGSLEIRPLEPERDAESLLATWAEVFGRERSRAEWNWQTLANPGGIRAFVALDGDRVVAQYAGVPQRVWIDGRERSFTQSVDSMVHPDYRKGLKRPGLFVELARAYFDHYGVRGPDAVHYGWPLEEAWRIGSRFLEYECVREELVLVRELDPAAREQAAALVAADTCGVHPLELEGDELRWLYERCSGAWGASCMRDADYYAWRFRDHPAVDYELLGARDAGGVLRGMAVLRRGDWLTPGSRALCDWLVPANEPEVAARLLAAAGVAASRDGGERLVTLLPEWSGQFQSFQADGWLVHPAPYRLAGRCFDRDLDPLFLREHWWMTLADSDLA